MLHTSGDPNLHADFKREASALAAGRAPAAPSVLGSLGLVARSRQSGLEDAGLQVVGKVAVLASATC